MLRASLVLKGTLLRHASMTRERLVRADPRVRDSFFDLLVPCQEGNGLGWCDTDRLVLIPIIRASFVLKGTLLRHAISTTQERVVLLGWWQRVRSRGRLVVFVAPKRLRTHIMGRHGMFCRHGKEVLLLERTHRMNRIMCLWQDVGYHTCRSRHARVLFLLFGLVFCLVCACRVRRRTRWRRRSCAWRTT